MKRRDFVKSLGSFALFPYVQEWPDRIDGVELDSLKKPVVMASRYPTWEYRPELSTVIPIRGVPGLPSNQGIIHEQDEELKRFNIGVDVIQFNPNPEYPDWNILRQHYLPASQRPFYLLYENHFGTRFRFNTDSNGNPRVDMGNPHNRNVFLEDLYFMFSNIIVPNRHRYVTVNGKAIVYIWASQLFDNAKLAFDEAKNRFPVFILGGDEPFHFPVETEDSRSRIFSMDGVMPYSLYRAGRYVGDYRRMIDDYFFSLANWAPRLRDNAPHIKIFATLQFAFDDTRSPAGRGRQPFYPNSIREVEMFAEMIRIHMGLTGGSLFGKPDWGLHVVHSEYFEGAAVEQSFPPHPGEPNWRIRTELSGISRLELVKNYFSS